MTARQYGDIDGEIPSYTTVRFTGEVMIDRALLHRERVALSVVGEVKSVSFKEHNGALLRTHALKVEVAVEPIDQLLTDVTNFVQAVEDARDGRIQLPLDNEEDEQ